jgi:DNA-binding SARP family transcriptional activator
MPGHDSPVISELDSTTLGAGLQLTLLDGFRLERAGRALAVSGRGQRLLALLALRGGATRTVIAGMLWPDVPEERARASVRTTVCEVQRSLPGLLTVGPQTLRLSAEVEVDVTALLALAGAALRSTVEPADGALPQSVVDLLPGHRLSGPLLAGWTDDWVLVESERLHHLRLHALDAWVDRALTLEFLALALALAEAAVEVDPLRESAHRRLMQIHLAQGNIASAVRQYHQFTALLHQALGIRPSRLIAELADSILLVSR